MVKLLDIPCERMKLNPYFIPYFKNSLKWIKYLSVRAKSINFLEEKTDINRYDFGLVSSFLDMIPQATKGGKLNWTLPEFKTCSS